MPVTGISKGHICRLGSQWQTAYVVIYICMCYVLQRDTVPPYGKLSYQQN